MPRVLTAAAQIACAHQGLVQLRASQQTTAVDGSPLLVVGDLAGAPIAGCTLAPGPNTKPCTAIATMTVGAATLLAVGGVPALLDTATGVTDSVPIGTWSVQSAGQTLLETS